MTPAIARSPDGPIDAVCASTDRDNSKQADGEASITVSSRIDGMAEL